MPSFNANNILQLLRLACDQAGAPLNRHGLKEVSLAICSASTGLHLSQRYLDEYVYKQAIAKQHKQQPVKLNGAYIDALARFVGFTNYHHFAVSTQKSAVQQAPNPPRALNRLPGPTLWQIDFYEKHMLILYELMISQCASIVIKHKHLNLAVRFIRHLIYFFKHSFTHIIWLNGERPPQHELQFDAELNHNLKLPNPQPNHATDTQYQSMLQLLNSLQGTKLLVIESIQSAQQSEYCSQLMKQLNTWQLVTCTNYDIHGAMAYSIDHA